MSAPQCPDCHRPKASKGVNLGCYEAHTRGTEYHDADLIDCLRAQLAAARADLDAERATSAALARKADQYERDREYNAALLVEERAAHGATRDTLDALRRNSGDVLGKALDELHDEREAHAGTIRLLRTMTDGYEDACNTIARYSEVDGVAPPPPVKSVALVREYLESLRAAPRAEGEPHA